MSDDGKGDDFWYVVRWTAVWGSAAAAIIAVPSFISMILWSHG